MLDDLPPSRNHGDVACPGGYDFCGAAFDAQLLGATSGRGEDPIVAEGVPERIMRANLVFDQ